MKQTSLIYMVIVAFALAACSKLPQRVEEALVLAGSNRAELQKVIDHYQASQDSLKLKATYFLITDIIPYGHYLDTEHSPAPKAFFEALEAALKPFFGKENKRNAAQRVGVYKAIKRKIELKHGQLTLVTGRPKSDFEP